MIKTLIYILTCSLFLILGCNPTVNEIDEKDSKENNKIPIRFVMTNKDSCNLTFTPFILDSSLIMNKWEYNLTWEYQKDCWYGIEYIDKTIFCEFFPTGKYIWKEIFTDTTLNSEEQGEYWLNMKNDSIILTFAQNEVGDTLFNHGDTMNIETALIYCLNKKKFSLRFYDYKSSNYKNTIFDFSINKSLVSIE